MITCRKIVLALGAGALAKDQPRHAYALVVMVLPLANARIMSLYREGANE